MYQDEFTNTPEKFNLDAEFERRVKEGGRFRPIKSELPFVQYQAFVNNEVKAQAEKSVIDSVGNVVGNTVKSLYNGAIVNSVHGIFGAAKAAIDANVALHQKEDPNYRPYADFAPRLSGALEAVIDNFQREEVKADSELGQLGYDLTEGIGQLAAQIVVAKGAGAMGTAAGIGSKAARAGSFLFNAANVAGNQYLDLRKEGVDAERAAQAGLYNAPIQAILEETGLEKILGKLPKGSGLRKKITNVFETALTEGITEGLQELPEQFTTIWAKDKNATAESMAAKWGENWEQNVKEVGYSALLGGLIGGGGKGLRVITNSVIRKTGEKITDLHKEEIVNQTDRVGKSKINLDYAAAAIDANSQGETISVEAKDVRAYMQQTNGEKLAQRLGVTVEQIEEAAELGQDIDISRGEYVAAAVENKGFLEATQGGMYFGVDGELAANAREKLKTLKSDRVFTEEVTAQLNTELDAIIKSATDAGMGKQHAENLRLMIESRAIIANPENPAAWLQKNKLRFENGGKKTLKSGWIKAAFLYNFGSTKSFKSEIARTPKEKVNKLSYKYAGKNGGNYEVLSSNFTHVDKNAHPLTDEQWDDVLSSLDDTNNIEFAKVADKKGSNGGVVVGQVVKGAHGKYAILTEFTQSGRVFVTTSGADGTTNMNVENWVKNIRGSQTLQHEAIKLNAGKMGQTSYIKMLQQKFGIVKNHYKQQEGMTDKGMISPMDDGTYVITLFKGADASTVIHETGHYFADTMIKEAIEDPSNKRLVRDAKILLEYGGMTMEEWQNASIEEKRAAHEKFAEAFETYLMEGKTPSVGLRGVFQRFSKWLTAIYSKFTRSKNAAELNDDVRGVFDRMLASQEEIEMQAQLNGILGEMPAELTSKLDDKARNTLQDKIMGAKDKAVDILTKKMMQDFNARRKAEKAAYIKEITPKVEEVIHNQKVNQAREQVGYWFGKEGKTNYPGFKNINGMAHANAQVKRWSNANASVIARKYRHAIGSVLPNYNDVLNDTKAAINDRLNPIIESLKSDIERYETELAENSDDKVRGVPGHWEHRQNDSVFSSYMDDANNEGFADAAWVKGQYAEDGKWTDRAIERAEVDGYVFVPASEGLANLNWYGRYVEENGRKEPTKTELRSIAEDIYRGEDRYGILERDRALYGGGGLEEKAFYEQQAKELDDLKKQLNYLEKSPEGVDLVKMAKRSALSDEQRQQFEMIAEELGYSSGDEMAQDILNNPSEKQMVRQLIDEAVQKRFPDIYKERELAEQAAREALYNDESGEVIALEHELIAGYLDEALGSVEYRQRAKAFAQMAKVKAREIISSMSVGDITKGNGKKFMLAERRAAANAAKAIKDGDLVAAEYHKQQQLINHELYRQALQIRGKVNSAQRFIRKMARMKKENFGTQQHFNQIGALLARMGVERRGYDIKTDKQSLPDYVNEMKTKCGEIVDIPEFVLNLDSEINDPMGMSFEHCEDVVNALKNIYAIAKYDTKMTKLGKEQSFDDTKQEIMEALKKHDVQFIPQVGTPQYSKWQRFKNWGREHWQSNRNADNFYLALDNWTEGWFTKNFYKPLNRCADDEASMQMDLQADYERAYREWAPTQEARNAAGTKQYYEELGASISKDELIQLTCNLGNDGNWHRLCETVPEGLYNSEIWVKESELVTKEQAAEMTRQRLVEFLGKNLTEADIKYAQAKIDACNKLWPRLRDVNIRTKGFTPKAVEATPVTFTLANGKTVYMRGGYFPLVRDTQMGSTPAGQNRIASTDESFVSGLNTMTTASGSSKERTRAKYPISLVAGCEINAINDTIHDIAFRETILDLRKIMNDEEIFREMKSRLGESNLKLLKENLEICANPRAYNEKVGVAEKSTNNILNWMRTMTVNASILGNIKTSFQNLGNIFLYARSVEGFGYADTLVAMKNAIPNHVEIDRLCQKSVFMKEKMIVPEYSLREINGRADLNAAQKQTLKWGAYMLSATDMATAKPVWAQAYSKKLNEGKTEAEAIEFADTVIRRTLGSSRIYDVASIRRGSTPFKLLTMFQGFFNTQFNQWDREGHLVAKLWKQGDKKEALLRLSAFIAGKWLAVCLANIFLALENPFEKDKDGYMKLTKELVNYPLSMGGPVGQVANVGVQVALGMRNYGYRFTPVQSTIDNAYTILRLGYRIGSGKAKDGEGKELAQRTFRLAANAYGIPSAPINLLYNAWDIGTDEMDFELQDLIKRRPRSERKHERELLAQRKTTEDED